MIRRSIREAVPDHAASRTIKVRKGDPVISAGPNPIAGLNHG
ncbi:hypothetical protein [uncultured Henriciella sp.]